MNRRSTYIGILIVLLILSGGIGYAYRIWNQDYPDIVKEKTKLSIDAQTLLEVYTRDETMANERYREKVIEVVGQVRELTFLNNRNTIILEGISTDNSILCDMQEGQYESIKKLLPGEQVRIKGICKGYLKDIILLQCILIKTQTQRNTNK